MSGQRNGERIGCLRHPAVPPQRASSEGERGRERVGDGVVRHVAVVLDQPARSIEVVDDATLYL